MTIIDLESPSTWPADLQQYLGAHHDLFLRWETQPLPGDGPSFDKAIRGLMEVLRSYSLIGWHCTRLTDTEMDDIVANGIGLPDLATLTRRIDAVSEGGVISTGVSNRLKTENQAHEKNRAGMVWFCFFPPRLAGQGGIERFFRHWGGEALYNTHEDDSETSPILRSIGTPAIVEAEVPISILAQHSLLDIKVARRFLISRGFQTGEPCDHEDRIIFPLPARNVRYIVRFPDPSFIELSGCNSWSEPMSDWPRNLAGSPIAPDRVRWVPPPEDPAEYSPWTREEFEAACAYVNEGIEPKIDVDPELVEILRKLEKEI
jgi:hypothetical protein